MVALAGHTLDGNNCSPCGTGPCICGPDGTARTPQPSHQRSHHQTGGLSDAGLGIGAILLVLGLMVTRMML
jgi:hypothetical protein